MENGGRPDKTGTKDFALGSATVHPFFLIAKLVRELCAGAAVMDRSDFTRGGDSAHPRAASKMIEQRSTEQRRRGDASLDEARLRQQAIGVKLRQMFDQVVNEEVPDEFLQILKKADERQSGEG